MSSPALPKQLFGMIHLSALPGTSRASLPVTEIVRHAVAEARIYHAAGFEGVLIENMHDTPYLARLVGPEIVATMAIAAQAVRVEFPGLVGVQILAGCNEQAIAVAHSAGLDFIRAEGFCFAHVADEGWLDACAGPLLRYRKMIGAEKVAIWADVKKKHSSHAVTADISLEETVHAAEFMGADAVIVTGRVTGDAPDAGEFSDLRGHTKLPIAIGSGITQENLSNYWPLADAFIVGSSLKLGGHWSNGVNPAAVEGIRAEFQKLLSF